MYSRCFLEHPIGYIDTAMSIHFRVVNNFVVFVEIFEKKFHFAFY